VKHRIASSMRAKLLRRGAGQQPVEQVHAPVVVTAAIHPVLRELYGCKVFLSLPNRTHHLVALLPQLRGFEQLGKAERRSKTP
jgi:hypothetical protein